MHGSPGTPAWHSLLLTQAMRNGALQTVSKVVSITNNLSTTVEASIRAGSSDRYTVHPQQVKLKPGQSSDVEVRLKVVRFAQTEKAVTQGQRDSFHIKAPFFDQKFSAIFFLSPQHLPATQGQQKPRAAVKTSDADTAAPQAQHKQPAPATAPQQHGNDARTIPATPERAPKAQHVAEHTEQKLFSFRLPDSPEPLPQRISNTKQIVCAVALHCIALHCLVHMVVHCDQHSAHNHEKLSHLDRCKAKDLHLFDAAMTLESQALLT